MKHPRIFGLICLSACLFMAGCTKGGGIAGMPSGYSERPAAPVLADSGDDVSVYERVASRRAHMARMDRVERPPVRRAPARTAIRAPMTAAQGQAVETFNVDLGRAAQGGPAPDEPYRPMLDPGMAAAAPARAPAPAGQPQGGEGAVDIYTAPLDPGPVADYRAAEQAGQRQNRGRATLGRQGRMTRQLAAEYGGVRDYRRQPNPYGSEERRGISTSTSSPGARPSFRGMTTPDQGDEMPQTRQQGPRGGQQDQTPGREPINLMTGPQ